MTLPLYTVDAFTNAPFSGNPAAVCLVGDRSLTDDAMQSLTKELNVSNTAFVEFEEPGSGSFVHSHKFKLRWFSPNIEVSLCGHATLASAAILFFECGNKNSEIVFSTLSGDLKATKQKDGVTLDFPNNNPVDVKRDEFQPIITALLGDESSDVKTVLLSEPLKMLLLVLQDRHSADRLKYISPDFDKLLAAHNVSRAKAVMVTTKGSSGYHFFSRYFAPWFGIREDPVCGSAHTVLGPYWSGVLQTNDLKARQCSTRGGDLGVKVIDERVYLTGSAVTVVRGTVSLPSAALHEIND